MEIQQKTIPNGWVKTDLFDNDFFDIVKSGIEKFSGEKKYLSTSSINRDRVISIEAMVSFNSRHSRANMLPVNHSVWFAKMKNTIKVIVADLDMENDAILSTGFFGVVPKKDKALSSYLKQIFLSDYFNNLKDANSTGSTMQGINNDGIKKIDILLPLLEEQKKITNILSTVDNEIEKTDEIISQTEKLKEGISYEFFTKGIYHQNFKKTSLGSIPANWNIKKLEDVVFFENGKAHENFIDDTGEFIIVNSKFIAQNGNVIKRTNKGLKILNKGDIAIVMSDIPQGKALAKCFFVDKDNKYTLNQRIGLLRPLSGYNKYFFYFLNRNTYFLNFSNETSQTNLRKQQVLDCSIVIPPVSEQKKIADILSAIDEKISINAKYKETLTKLKKGLMQDLLSGNKRVKI